MSYISLHLLYKRIMNKLHSLTCKVLATSQPDYLDNMISVQSTFRTRSSSVVTLARPYYKSPTALLDMQRLTCAWNQLPSLFRQPHSVHPPPGSPHSAHITSSQSPSITHLTFHSRLKTRLFHKSFPP